jgi:hypothetical protein
MFVILSNKVVEGSEMVDVITIYNPLYDARDNTMTKGGLSSDGKFITVTEASTPTYLVKEAKAVHGLEGTHVCEATMRSHQVAANGISTKDSHKLKKYILYFSRFAYKCLQTRHKVWQLLQSKVEESILSFGGHCEERCQLRS